MGWRIWEWYGIMIEAEFHMVWESPDGKILDLTPAPEDEERILFLRDDSLIYEGKQIDNIRRSLTKNHKVNEFIETSESIFKLMNIGGRAFNHGYITLTPNEAIERKLLELKKMELFVAIENTAPERNELCRCGSGKKSKKCCY